MCKVWLEHLAEGIGGKLATFTSVHLIADVSCRHAVFTHPVCQLAQVLQKKKKKTPMLTNLLAALLQLSWPTKISDIESEIQSIGQEQITGPCYSLYTTWITMPSEREIWPDS